MHNTGYTALKRPHSHVRYIWPVTANVISTEMVAVIMVHKMINNLLPFFIMFSIMRGLPLPGYYSEYSSTTRSFWPRCISSMNP